MTKQYPKHYGKQTILDIIVNNLLFRTNVPNYHMNSTFVCCVIPFVSADPIKNKVLYSKFCVDPKRR